MIDAVEASRFLIPEKIKKFAKVARTIETITKIQFVFPETNTSLIEPLLKNKKGNMMIAVIIELMKTSVAGAIFTKTF